MRRSGVTASSRNLGNKSELGPSYEILLLVGLSIRNRLFAIKFACFLLGIPLLGFSYGQTL